MKRRRFKVVSDKFNVLRVRTEVLSSPKKKMQVETYAKRK